MAFISSNKYQIPIHNHDLTNVMCLSQSQSLSKSRKNIVDFSSQELIDKYSYKYEVNVGGNKVSKTLSFRTSDNIFDDFCIIERQILDEISNRESEITRVLNKYASMDEYGLIKVGQDSGLNITDGVLSADFSTLQPKLVSGENIKLIKIGDTEIDLLMNSIDDDKFIELVTPKLLDEKIGELNDKFGTFDTLTGSQFEKVQAQFAKYNASIANLQGQVIDVLNDLSLFQPTEQSVTGMVGIVQYKGTSISQTCDPVVLTTSKSYYRKVLTESMSNCSPNDSTMPYFTFDTNDLITSGQEYMVVKFELDIEAKEDGLVDDVNRMPWEWIGTPPDMSKWGNTIVEIRGYWKCDIWNWFGRLVHQYQINCDDLPIV